MNIQNTYCVYKHIAPNRKIYVGVTGRTLEERFHGGDGYRNNKHFSAAIEKYGWGNIKHEVIASGLDRDSAMDLEKKCIAEYRSSEPEFGYNKTLGGESGLKHTENVKKVISKKLKAYYSVPEHKEKVSKRAIGHKHSEETKQKMSEAHRNISDETRLKLRLVMIGKKHPHSSGFRHSEETKRLISEKKRGKHFGGTGKKPQKVLCVETGIVYDSVKDASLKMSLKDSSSIWKVCSGQRKKAYGYRWQYVI